MEFASGSTLGDQQQFFCLLHICLEISKNKKNNNNNTKKSNKNDNYKEYRRADLRASVSWGLQVWTRRLPHWRDLRRFWRQDRTVLEAASLRGRQLQNSPRDGNVLWDKDLAPNKSICVAPNFPKILFSCHPAFFGTLIVPFFSNPEKNDLWLQKGLLVALRKHSR